MTRKDISSCVDSCIVWYIVIRESRTWHQSITCHTSNERLESNSAWSRCHRKCENILPIFFIRLSSVEIEKSLSHTKAEWKCQCEKNFQNNYFYGPPPIFPPNPFEVVLEIKSRNCFSVPTRRLFSLKNHISRCGMSSLKDIFRLFVVPYLASCTSKRKSAT